MKKIADFSNGLKQRFKKENKIETAAQKSSAQLNRKETNMNTLTQKATQEFNDFIRTVKEKLPDEIVQAAYEIALKQEFLGIIENTEFCEDEQSVLESLDYPLDALYTRWLKNDYSFEDILNQTIRDCIERHREYEDEPEIE